MLSAKAFTLYYYSLESTFHESIEHTASLVPAPAWIGI